MKGINNMFKINDEVIFLKDEIGVIKNVLENKKYKIRRDFRKGSDNKW